MEKEIIRGGGFLLQESVPAQIFSPEDFTEEQVMIAQTTTEFMDQEVIPNHERLEQKDYELQRELIQKGADLGLINAAIPEEYGGLALDHVSQMLVAEFVSGQASFATGFGATASACCRSSSSARRSRRRSTCRRLGRVSGSAPTA